jgi:adenylylsulfate kinase
MTGVVVWFTGRPASGKSTLARNVQAEAIRRGWPCCCLDGDEVRAALLPKPGYDALARDDFYSTLANLAVLLARQGIVVLVPATAHRAAFRERARSLTPHFVEVWVDVPESTLEARDPKGLYAAARAGSVSELPGVDLEYEAPTSPDVIATGGQDRVALERIVDKVAQKLQ